MTEIAGAAPPATRGSQILANAARLFSERGFGESSMRDLAAVNDLSLAGLYHYFPSKGAILSAIVDEAVDHLVEAIRDAVAGSDTPEERIREVFRALVLTVVRHREAVHTLFENIGKLSPEHQQRVRAKQHEATVLLRSELRTMARRGVMRDVDPAVAVFSLIGMTNWTYFWYRDEGELSAEQIADDMAAIFMHGVVE